MDTFTYMWESRSQESGQGCCAIEGSSLHLSFPPRAPAIGCVKASQLWKPGPMQINSSPLSPFLPILRMLLFNPRSVESRFLPPHFQSFKPLLFPPSQAFSIRPVPSLGTDPCWMLPGSMSTVPALPTVYRLGRLFP